MIEIVNERARPFYFPGGSTGCLLLHGFTGSPTEMRWLGEYLATKGFTVYGVRLSAHGTHIGDMRRASWRDWVASAQDGWYVLRDMVENIFLIGLSMGGALAALLASQHRAAGLVMMSTPYALPADWRLSLARPFSVLWPFVGKGHDRDRDPEVYDEQFSYALNPTRGIAELDDLLAKMRQALPRLALPALVMHSREDQYVLPHNGEAVYAAIGSAHKSIEWVAEGGHVITLEPQRQWVYQRVAKFIDRICKKSSG